MTNKKCLSLEKARIIAHCLFDGWIFLKKNKKTDGIDSYYMGYSNKNRVLINQFVDDARSVYKLNKPTKQVRPNVTLVSFGSKFAVNDVLSYIENYGKEETIPNDIINANVNVKRAFVRAFFDDERRIIYDPNLSHRVVAGKIDNHEIRKQIVKLLKSFDIFGRENGKDVTITGKSNLKQFRKHIGFTKGVRVVRRSKFSRWYGKDKNFLLSTMISTYKH